MQPDVFISARKEMDVGAEIPVGKRVGASAATRRGTPSASWAAGQGGFDLGPGVSGGTGQSTEAGQRLPEPSGFSPQVQLQGY